MLRTRGTSSRAARARASKRRDGYDGAALGARTASSADAAAGDAARGRHHELVRPLERERYHGRRQEVVAGAGEIEESLGGVRFRVSADSFFQVNVEMLERIFAYLESRLAMPCRIVDLYCGVGTFALFFAAHGCMVLGVEENAQAVAKPPRTRALNALDRPRGVLSAGRVERLPSGRRCARPCARRSRLPRSAAQRLRRGYARRDRRRGRAGRLVPLLRPGNARTGFEVPGGQRLPPRHRGAVRHVSANGTRRSARPSGVFVFCHPIRSTSATSPHSLASR